MRVVVADAQEEVRSALRLLLTSAHGMCVVGEAADAAALRGQIRDMAPNLVLLDWGLLGVGAGSALAEMRASYPQVQLIVLSGRSEVRQQALAAGAHGFVSKSDSPEQVGKVLRTLQDWGQRA
jgi:DNA-binding NarL/FixJ family response regulator